MLPCKRILITPGEPAGAGPDISIQIAKREWPAELVVIADPNLLFTRAKQLNLTLQLIESDPQQPRSLHKPGVLKIYPVSLNAPVETGKLSTVHAEYVLNTLRLAASLCRDNLADALVTGPVHKGIINQAGIAFSGHTEFFAHFCEVEQTVMLFVADRLKAALLTTHLPLAQVPEAIHPTRITQVVSILSQGLARWFRLLHPRILVCGLNPHAGESGYLGREEIDIITPTLNKLRLAGLLLEGPLPADTIFTPQQLQRADVVLGMYHDQVLPVIKYAAFGHAVNMTLGLPFVRTSVDHGTALDIAGTGKSDAGSLAAALTLAIQLAQTVNWASNI